jgi:hypothetical protein
MSFDPKSSRTVTAAGARQQGGASDSAAGVHPRDTSRSQVGTSVLGPFFPEPAASITPRPAPLGQ